MPVKNRPLSEGERVERQFLELGVVYKAIEAEVVDMGRVPDEMWEAMNGDRDATEEALRIAVRMTKIGIKERLSKKMVVKIEAHPNMFKGLEEDHGG